MKLTKSAALKVALLGVLALNVSWERIEFGTAELAGEGVVKGSGTTDTKPTDAAATAPTSKTPEQIAVKVETAPVVEKKTVASSFHEKLEICGEEYVLRYEQVERGGTNTTEISARRSTRINKDWEAIISVEKDLVNTVAKKESAHRLIVANVKASRADAKESCPDAVADKEAKDKSDKETAEAKAEKEEKQKSLADDVKNCKVDRNGGSLDRGDKIACLISAIDHVDKRIDKKKDGKRLSEAEEKRAALAEVTKLYKELKSHLRAELVPARKKTRFSKRGEDFDYEDNDRTEILDAAREDVEEAIEALRSVESQYDLDRVSDRSGRRSSRRSSGPIDKMVGELEALLKGAEISEKNESYFTQLKEYRDDQNYFYEEAYRNPMDPVAKMNYQQAAVDYVNMRGEIERTMSASNNELRSLQKYLDRNDFRDFSRSSEDLRNLLSSNGRSAIGGRSGQIATTGPINSSIPNLAAMRTNTVGVNGFPATAPVINLPVQSNYQTPGLIPNSRMRAP